MRFFQDAEESLLQTAENDDALEGEELRHWTMTFEIWSHLLFE